MYNNYNKIYIAGLDGGIAVTNMWQICHILLLAICGGKFISPIFDFMLLDNFCDIVKILLCHN